MTDWLFLAAAIICDVAATVMLRQADGFRAWIPSSLAVAGYVASLPLLSLALRSIPIGTTYAVWSGLGTAAVATIGIVVFRERVTPLKLAAIALIIAGVAALRIADHPPPSEPEATAHQQLPINPTPPSCHHCPPTRQP
jgi:multidrug transporter EmrE-like cation transporter